MSLEPLDDIGRARRNSRGEWMGWTVLGLGAVILGLAGAALARSRMEPSGWAGLGDTLAFAAAACSLPFVVAGVAMPGYVRRRRRLRELEQAESAV